jgi:hypothetical protein
MSAEAGVAEGLSWARDLDAGETNNTRLKATALDAVLHISFMDDLLTFFPLVGINYVILKIFHPIDQQDDITVMINSGQTNRFSLMNKNRLAKDNFWR